MLCPLIFSIAIMKTTFLRRYCEFCFLSIFWSHFFKAFLWFSSVTIRQSHVLPGGTVIFVWLFVNATNFKDLGTYCDFRGSEQFFFCRGTTECGRRSARLVTAPQPAVTSRWLWRVTPCTCSAARVEPRSPTHSSTSPSRTDGRLESLSTISVLLITFFAYSCLPILSLQ